jgi:hypothetical protein
VLQKREEIKKELAERQAEIVSGEVVVFVEDECHLVEGYSIGYVGAGGMNGLHLTKTPLKMFGCKEKIFCEGIFFENKTFKQVKSSLAA